MNVIFSVKDISDEHLGVMQLSSVLKRAGHKARAVEAQFSPMAKALSQEHVSLVAYSVPTLYYEHYRQLNQKLKNSFKFFSVFGGPHPTIVPEIIKDESIDCVCRGEGEYAFLELVEKMEKSQPFDMVDNLWVKTNGRITMNPIRPLIPDLDELPFPDRDVFPRTETACKGKMHVITSRGCPHQCHYCCQPVYDKLYNGKFRYVRRRSVENVIREILEVMRKTKISFAMFEDDLFVSSKEWIKDFCDQYSNKIKIPFFCYVRADMVSLQTVRLLKSAGCRSISMGLETAHEASRRDILGRTMDLREVVEAARVIKSEGLRLETTNIVGIPPATIEQDFETLRFNIKIKADYTGVKILMPYPGTAVRELLIKKGFWVPGSELSHWEYPFRVKSKIEKRQFENLRMLFPITARLPFLLPLTRRIISLPLGGLYKYIFLLWEGVSAYFLLYPTGIKGFFEGSRKYLLKLLKS